MQPALLIDLDGTIYKDNQIIDGAAEFMRRLNQTNTALPVCHQLGNQQAIASSLRSMGLN